MRFYQIVIIIGVFVILLFLIIPDTLFRQIIYPDDQYKIQLNDYSYSLNKPKRKWELPVELTEISGLSYFDTNQLACVQDEKGILFIYDLAKSEIIKEYGFGKNADYEGVEIVNGLAYVLKSNGLIYRFVPGVEPVSKIETGLSGKNDTEGLGYSAKKNALLVACKETAGLKNEEITKARAIYIVPIDQGTPITRILLDHKSYGEALRRKGLNLKEHMPFKPSGIAEHPDSGLWFIIASVGKLLLIIRPDGTIVDAIPLRPDIFLQPEGIAFGPDGGLYISSEGKGGNGYILKF